MRPPVALYATVCKSVNLSQNHHEESSRVARVADRASWTGRAFHGGVRGRVLGLADRDALQGVRDRADEAWCGRLEDVSRDTLAAGEPAVGPHRHPDLSERVGAAGDGLDLVALELGIGACRVADRPEDRVDGPVAGGLRN